METPSPVIKVGSQWRRTPVPFTMNEERIYHLTHQREQEWEQVQQYLGHPGCLMSFLRNSLDDPATENCGRCSICLQQLILPITVDPILVHQVATFLKHAEIVIKPKKQVAANAFIEYGFKGNLATEIQAQEGRVLSRWGDAGWGKMVLDNKHNNHFSDELADALVEMIHNRWQPEPYPTWVCCVPSLNHLELVPNFAQRLAIKLGIPFINTVVKTKENQPQKAQQNRFHQCSNLDGVFAIGQPIPDGPVFLVDDIVDSGWTLTVISALLQEAGSGIVYPLALASTSVKDT